ncbi:MAG: ribosomal-protein-alanine N-acetyltransferase [Dehalococcoidia bacterium]|nr:ribosomal-protein-alanine N-acetyltransferase [Dehalococcoidia bacterium]
MGYGLRPLELQDVPQVAEIEKEAFPTLWPPTPFRRDLHNRLARYLVAWEVPGSQAQNPAPALSTLASPFWRRLFRNERAGFREPAAQTPPQHLVGYEGIWFMVDEAHITAVGVRESQRGRGIGELLIIGAVEMAYLQRSRVVTLEVRVSNHVAQSLYRKYGFKEEGVRKGYYVDNNEDALIMTTSAINTPDYRESFQALLRAHEERRGSSQRILGS